MKKIVIGRISKRDMKLWSMNGNDVKRWEEAKEMAKNLEISVQPIGAFEIKRIHDGEILCRVASVARVIAFLNGYDCGRNS